VNDVFIRHYGCKIQSTPAMQANATQQSQRDVGLVLSVWPKFRSANRDLDIGHLVLRAFYAYQNEQLNAALQRLAYATHQRSQLISSGRA